MASSSAKISHKYTLDDSDIGSVDKLNGMCIYCHVFTKKVKMKYAFRG